MSSKLSKFAAHGQALVCERPVVICAAAFHPIGSGLSVI
ncbi:MAG: hypothetical protein RL145_58, partial [Pseudomonadota bacterium]